MGELEIVCSDRGEYTREGPCNVEKVELFYHVRLHFCLRWCNPPVRKAGGFGRSHTPRPHALIYQKKGYAASKKCHTSRCSSSGTR